MLDRNRKTMWILSLMVIWWWGGVVACAAGTDSAVIIQQLSPDQNLLPFDEPTRPPQYKIIDDRFGYQLLWRPRLEYKITDFDAAHTSIHTCQDAPFGGPWVYNWVVRRDPCTVVSGDLPRFALMRTYREPTVAPPFHKMADLRIRLNWDGKSCWLDDVDGVEANFFPWGTIHRVNLRPTMPLSIEFTTALVANRGLAVQVSVEVEAGSSDGQPIGSIDFFVGGMDVKGPQFIPPYLLSDTKEAANDLLEIEPGEVLLSDPSMPDRLRISCQPQGQISVNHAPNDEMGNRLLIHHELSGNGHQLFRILACQTDANLGSELKIEDFDALLKEAKQYYADLLDSFEIRTPDRHLNAAFYAAIVNLEYLYQPPAWLEGIHEWNSYYCNNYSISSAIDLGQLDRAREALIFLGEGPTGPAPVAPASGPTNDPLFEAGLPYYILQLHRYWRATGDTETLDRLFKATSENLGKMLKKRDPEGNLLLNWYQGCNSFMYQADHLSQPGDAPSPTYMAIGDLEQMAELAEVRADVEQASRWRCRAAYMRDEALRRLWRPAEGRMATIDTQGRVQPTNFYTDFVFPILYGSISAEHGYILLRTMDRKLWVGDHLMRCGNLKPPLFGNDVIAPVQMSEAAEAYFAMGRAERGWALLHGIGLASTTYTNSPGAFPEYMTNSGYGQADYVFGQPAAAYVHAVVGGLFGFERQAVQTPAIWHPAIPADWSEASLKLDDVSFSVDGQHGDRLYVISLTKPQSLDCRLPLYGHQVSGVRDEQGQPIPFRIESHPGGGFIHIKKPKALRHAIHLLSHPIATSASLLETTDGQRVIECQLPVSDMAIIDPQGMFTTFRIEGRQMTAHLKDIQELGVFFLCDRQNQRMIPIELSSDKRRPNAVEKRQPVLLKGRREPIDLSTLYNTETFQGRNLWRFNKNKIDLTSVVTQIDGKHYLQVGDTKFSVRPSGRNILGLEIGALNGVTMELYLTGLPWKTGFNIDQSICGIEFLTVCELQTRLTGMQVGHVTIHYSDGFCQIEPLVYGHNIDCYRASFADGVEVRKLGAVQHLSAFAVEVNPSRIVERFEIEVTSPETFIGIMGINLVVPESGSI